MAYGFVSALVGGLAWGAVAAITGYIFCWGAILIGLLIAFAVKTGARQVTTATLVLVGILVIFSIFVGEIVGVSIVAAPYGATVVDVIVAYPGLVAEFPGDFIPSYIFGLVGMIYIVGSLWSSRSGPLNPAPPPYPGYSPPGPPAFPPGPPAPQVPVSSTPTRSPIASAPAAAGPPEVRVVRCEMSGLQIEIRIQDRPRAIAASYLAATDEARVEIDGQPFAALQIGRFERVVNVPLQGAKPHRLSLRFATVPRPLIDVHFDSSPVSVITPAG